MAFSSLAAIPPISYQTARALTSPKYDLCATKDNIPCQIARRQATAQLRNVGHVKAETRQAFVFCFDCNRGRGEPTPAGIPEPDETPEPKDDPPHTYPIFLPGVQDFIVIPALRSPELRMQQVRRMFASGGIFPESIRWIPSVINFLDDAQDLLITALVLAKPLLRRLPARFIPGLGWILTINDALNLTNALLGTAFASRTFKRSTLRSALWMWTRRSRRLRAVKAFLNSTKWIPFYLQAGQALTQLTRYGAKLGVRLGWTTEESAKLWSGTGLSLGALMGLVSSPFWAVVRLAQGNKVKIINPPSEDITMKAARYMAQYPQQVWMKDILTEDEHYMCIAAAAIATQVLRDSTPASLLESRGLDTGELSMPTFYPWNPSSVYALERELHKKKRKDLRGLEEAINNNDYATSYSPDEEKTGDLKQYLPFDYPYPMIDDVLRETSLAVPDWEEAMKALFGPSTRGTIAGMLHNETTIEQFNWALADIGIPLDPRDPEDKVSYTLQSGNEPVEQLFEGFEIDASHAIEYSVFPTQDLTPEELDAWLTTARLLSQARGLDHASFGDLKLAAVETIGGFTRRPYVTFREG